MNYARYSLGSYARSFWVECHDCGTKEKPHYVFQREDRSINFQIVVGAVMQHEIAAHASNPHKPVIKR